MTAIPIIPPSIKRPNGPWEKRPAAIAPMR